MLFSWFVDIQSLCSEFSDNFFGIVVKKKDVETK